MTRSRPALILLTSLLGASLPLSGVDQVWLSSLDLNQAQQGWGTPGIDCSVEGKPLTIAGRHFEHGYGTHAPGEVALALQGGSRRFTAQVGIDDEGGAIGTRGSVEFVITGDGTMLWRSGLMRGGDAAKTVDLDISAITALTLTVSDGGDGSGCDHADWADAAFQVIGMAPHTVPISRPPRWSLGEGTSTLWNVSADAKPDHGDFIEQGGKRAGQVVFYAIASDRTLNVKRSVIWPSLRIIPNNTHGSLIHSYGTEAEPVITVDGTALGSMTVSSVILDGTMTLHAASARGLDVVRCTFPTTEQRAVMERWTLRNTTSAAVTVTVAPLTLNDQVRGPYGMNVMEVSSDAPATTRLAAGAEMTFTITFAARLMTDAAMALDGSSEEAKRRSFVAALGQDLRLETPDPVLDRTFAMAKIRVAESINATRGGLMLAPGGLSFYAATWCNDNVEYAGPFFPFLGDDGGNQASLDSYRGYTAFMKADYHAIPSSIVAEGTDTWHGAGDRGDAAMYAYGCARFCLARGDRAIADELWPAIAWCLEYCKRQTRPDGAITSNSDELEGRFPTGKANLSTISLYYGGLRSAAHLARALNKPDAAADYDQHAEAVAAAIDSYFGATVEGFATYRYFDGNDVLRSWICLPLCMGVAARRDATIAALLSPRLWTADGLATQAGDKIFWDRSTLYGLRGVFQAGATEQALRYLQAYSARRLLGEHVPYAVETGKQGSQLSSESGLYCRIFIEGLFGILPTGLDRFTCTPRLPDAWPRMALRSVRAFDRRWDLLVERQGDQLLVTATATGHPPLVQRIAAGGTAEFQLP